MALSESHFIFSQPGFLTLQDAAKWASVSKKSIERWIKKGLPVYQSGPRMKRLVRPRDIEQFLKTTPTLEIGFLTQLVSSTPQNPNLQKTSKSQQGPHIDRQ